MKDEIKEILDIIKKVSKAEVNSYNGLIETPPMKWEILYDYITNLQKIEQQYSAILSENAELENKITNLQEENKNMEHELQQLYKIKDNLQEKINQYENPDDLTLFYMWLDEKAKDKMKQLQEENERLKEENKRIFSKVNDDELLISNAMNYAEAQDYKSRNEKAIYYIWKEIEQEYDEENNKWLKEKIDNLLNILQGSEKE